MTFEDFNLDPAHNVLPDGSLTLGAPERDAGIFFPADSIPFLHKTSVALDLFRDCVTSGRISLKKGPQIMFFVSKQGGVISRVNHSGDINDRRCWETLSSASVLSDDHSLLKDLADSLKAENIAVFIESADGALYPVANKADNLSEWQEKEFHL